MNAFSGRRSNYIYRRADNTFEGFRFIDSRALSCNAEIVTLAAVDDSQKNTLIEYFKSLKVIKRNKEIESDIKIDGDFPDVKSYQTASDME
jgi:hypothetical protein